MAEAGPSDQSVWVLGEGVTARSAALRLALAGRDTTLEEPAALWRRRRSAGTVYLCLERDEGWGPAGSDLLREVAAGLSRTVDGGRERLLVVHGGVPPGTCDWLQHILSECVVVVYLGTWPDAHHGGPIIGAGSAEVAARAAALEGVAHGRYSVLPCRTAELADVTRHALAAVENEVGRTLAGPARAEASAAAVSTLVTLAELAGCDAPFLCAVGRGQSITAGQLPQIATGRAFLAGRREALVDSAGPRSAGRAAGGRAYVIAKRSLDLLLGVVGLLLVGPAMALIAALILLESGRPVVFKARRMGQDGRPFEMLKFRSMRHEAPRTANKTETEDYATRLGRHLRRYSLDELPQLFNLLAGTMSLVGPRPEQPFIVDWYQPWQRERLAVPPGITGWWQVNMRDAEGEMYRHVEYDVWYVRHRSFWLDLRILLRTPGALSGLGARHRSVAAGGR